MTPRLLALAVLALLPPACASSRASKEIAIHFDSPRAAVAAASGWIAARDWASLTRAYDLSLTRVKEEELLSGRFFVDESRSAHEGPTALDRYRNPFPPGSEFVTAEALGDPGRLPCIWMVTTARSFDAGGGMMQRVLRTCHMIERAEGFRFLPPAAIDDGPAGSTARSGPERS